MLNAAEIAKQADAMLAEREQEMKELEQQKRRARDIMFKKTQQLKVRPLNPASGIRVVGKGSWKKQEVGKFLFKLERTERNCKVSSEVVKFLLELESFIFFPKLFHLELSN